MPRERVQPSKAAQHSDHRKTEMHAVGWAAPWVSSSRNRGKPDRAAGPKPTGVGELVTWAPRKRIHSVARNCFLKSLVMMKRSKIR